MSNKLYVSNLPFSIDDSSLKDMFSPAGQVQSAKVIMDRDSGRNKGFGFVEMTTAEEAKNAIQQLNGSELNGRALGVAEARPQQPRDNNRGGGYGGGNRGGSGGRSHSSRY